MSEPKRRPGRPPKPGSRAWMIRQAEDAEAAGLPPPGPPVSAPAAAALAAAPAAAAATAPSSPDETDAARYSSEMKDLESRVQDSLDSVWETESLFEDALEDLAEDKFFVDDPNACTPEESVAYRQQLRAIGPEEFCRRLVDAGLITAKKLLTAFGVKPPAFLEGEDDDAYFGLLALALSRELSKRAKLLRFNTVDDAVELLKKSNNIICLTGAGISTSLGIPDFRSKGTGLYEKLKHLGLSDPQEVFDINMFREDPNVFFSVARDILVSTDKFTPTHAFIALLQSKGKLLTNYSQNIDNLEAKAGIRPEKLVQCHGSFATATCFQCQHKVEGETIFPDIRAGRIPRCPRCAQASSLGPGRAKRKRSYNGERGRGRGRGGRGGYGSGRNSADDSYSDDDTDYDMLPPGGGVMKPDITFFGESLPDVFSRRLTEHDRDRVDLVVVIGTSLKVAPVSEVIPYLPPHIPQIYISRTPVGHVNFDIDLLGDCDVVVAELCRRAGWDLRHEMIPPSQLVEIKTEDGWTSRHMFTDVTPKPSAAARPNTARAPAAASSSKASVLAAPKKPSDPPMGTFKTTAPPRATGGSATTGQTPQQSPSKPLIVGSQAAGKRSANGSASPLQAVAADDANGSAVKSQTPAASRAGTPKRNGLAHPHEKLNGGLAGKNNTNGTAAGAGTNAPMFDEVTADEVEVKIKLPSSASPLAAPETTVAAASAPVEAVKA